jgi:hypothetical protein
LAEPARKEIILDGTRGENGPMQTRARRRLAPLLALLALPALPRAALAQDRSTFPHTPTEEEVKRRETAGVDPDSRDRGYQDRAALSLHERARSAASWVRGHLSGVQVTPARLAVGIGGVGVLYTLGKNRRQRKWLVLTCASVLLLLGGVLALLL